MISDAISMCVGADQEHSSLMGEHCLDCSTLQTFYHGRSPGAGFGFWFLLVIFEVIFNEARGTAIFLSDIRP